MIRRPPRSTLFPYTPLFRSVRAERRERLLLGQRKRLRELPPVLRHPHPLPAPARGGLDDHGEAELLGELEPGVRVLHRTGRPGHGGHLEPLGELARRGLVAHLADLLPRRADEGDVRRAYDVGEFGVLGEKAVAGVEGVRARDLGRGDDARNVQVAVARRRPPDAHVVVGEAGVEAVAIRLGVHGHRLDRQLLARTDHPQGDLPAVGDQHLLEHQGVMSPRRPAAVVVPPNDWLCPEATPATFSANPSGTVPKKMPLSELTMPCCYHWSTDWSKLANP